MKKKYFILAVTFLSLLVGQSSYSQDWEDDGDWGNDWENDWGNDWENDWGDMDGGVLDEVCVGSGCDMNGGVLDEIIICGNCDNDSNDDLYNPYDYPDDDDDDDDQYPDNDLPSGFTDSNPPDTCTLVACSKGYQLNKEECKCDPILIPWYLDNDGDGWHSKTEEAAESPGSTWTKTTSGKDCDDNNSTITNNCYQNYYIDNDGDGWDSGTVYAENDNGGLYKTTTNGSDCDDNPATGANVHKLNKCGKCEAEPVNGSCGGGNPCNIIVNFGDNVNINSINQCSLQLIKEIADKVGIDKFKITSAVRSSADQARAMFNNIQLYGVAKQKALYGSYGDSVIDAYASALAAGKNDAEIKQAMIDKINEIGAYNVSNHSGDPNVLTVVDISPSSIPLSNRSEFVDAINRAISDGVVSKFLHPGNSKDPAYHIEIKVKNCNLINCN